MKEEVILEIERIRQNSGGTLNPAVIVREAEPPASILHNYFEWDDTKAAHEYRLEQARKLIRICVRYIPDGPDEPVRAYVSLQDDRGTNGYRSITDVMSDERLREKLLAEAKRDMNLFRQKYAVLRELAQVFEAMDAVV